MMTTKASLQGDAVVGKTDETSDEDAPQCCSAAKDSELVCEAGSCAKALCWRHIFYCKGCVQAANGKTEPPGLCIHCAREAACKSCADSIPIFHCDEHLPNKSDACMSCDNYLCEKHSGKQHKCCVCEYPVCFDCKSTISGKKYCQDCLNEAGRRPEKRVKVFGFIFIVAFNIFV
jgi:hypothetical protein